MNFLSILHFRQQGTFFESMKRYVVTMVMAVVLAGLGGYVYWVELPTERAKTETEATEKKLLPFTEREITGVTVHSESGDIVLVSKDGTWQMTAPIQTEADARVVQSMLRALALGRITRVVEEQATALGPFGLDKPSMILTLTADSQHETVSIGESGPISSTLYAMRASDKKVLLTDLSTKDFLNKTLLSFRKKEVLPLESSQVERVRLTYPKTEIVLYRTDAKDNKKKWSIRYPIEASADQAEVRTLLMKLDDLKALAFIDPGPQRDEQALLGHAGRLRRADCRRAAPKSPRGQSSCITPSGRDAAARRGCRGQGAARSAKRVHRTGELPSARRDRISLVDN